MGDTYTEGKQRIIQEYVPGKQVTLCHVIASPNADLYQKLGLTYANAIGIVNVTPAEASIIAADIATKAANVEIGFMDRFTGALVLTGDVASVSTALDEINRSMEALLGFTPCQTTRT